MKKFDYLKYWRAFLAWPGLKRFVRWSGWRACGNFFMRGWKATVSWSGWMRMFGIPVLILLVLTGASAAALVFIFCNHLELSIPAYPVYVLSAYCLTALAIKIPGVVKGIHQWLARHPRIVQLMGNEELKFKLELYFEQFINFVYGIFKIVSGVIYASAWIGADGIYNFTQGAIQLFQILRRRKEMSIVQQWKSYRLCGWLVLFMHLTMTGLVFQMVNWGRAEDYPGYMIFATAAFAFYKIISSFIDVAKDRRHSHPVDSAVRMLDLSQAIFSMFSLQVSMFHAFGTGEAWEKYMNLGTGCAVCLLVVAMGIYMIRRGNREIKKYQEDPHE